MYIYNLSIRPSTCLSIHLYLYLDLNLYASIRPSIYVYVYIYMGVSENSVPLNPMVNDHYPVFKWL